MNIQMSTQVLITALGGSNNIEAASHCATRLRLVLKDESILDQAKIDGLDIVKATFSTGGQYQVIIGTGTVNLVYAELSKQLGITEMSTQDVKAASAEKLNLIQRFVKMLSDIFVPIIPAIVAGGLLMGINNLLTAKDLFYVGESLIDKTPALNDLASMINTFSNAAFVFLPVLIGFSATKRFGGNPFLGATLGMIMVHPDLMNAYDANSATSIPYWDIFGMHIEKLGYQGQVLPVLVASYVLAFFEKSFRRFIPAALDMLLTPLFAILVTSILTFIALGPITRELGEWIMFGILWLFNSLGVLGGFLFGFFYAPIVITGMHHSFIALETQLLANMGETGGSFIFPIAAMSNVAQGAAALAAFFIIKDAKMKGVASASGFSALLGITEPAMFGVNLKLRYPFYAAILGSGFASAFIAYQDVLAIALGAAGLPGIISIAPKSLFSYIIGMAIAFTIAFSMTFILAKRQAQKEAM
ncbi:sucrose-specific PTS transporter subunit IIBC [Thorsellia anophelis]|uniref:protein-N(pi)-phosphohistidine--sucrose phosphotransferase n=1 Tax=Thorsellia anophelis DSM 18579 TaxID=1123402 RepID=A0A1H9YU03_9GAMM|nr:sucrose-specific PTS transporter subunit IIBC [Thorsellia anophelis]SES72606.1 PTS system sucrose-specific IIB component, Glc family (TC 4.A.1.2.12)/PTS system sucrose-specific IIC component, Glc family (TC 4.A.1.2.12) [Thorsellia anophelis DSM 18579]